jgi:hypothetical protein
MNSHGDIPAFWQCCMHRTARLVPSVHLSLFTPWECETMKRRFFGIVAVVLVGIIFAAVLARTSAQEAKKSSGKLRHIVMFKFKDGTTPEQIKSVENAFRALPSKVPEIAGFEWGTNNSPENKADGFTHCFFVTFKSEADRAVYLPHPAHKEFGKVLHPYLDKVLVVDYFAQD